MSHLIRVSIIGSMPNGEVWSVNPVYRLGTGGEVPVSPAQLTTIVTAIAARAVPTGILTALNSTTDVKSFRVEARLLNGTLQGLAEAAKAVPTPGQGLGVHPFQTAIVASLKTGTAGARGRGRLYWPATGLAINTANLRPTAANITSVLSGVKTYLSGIETDIETSVGGASLAVWSRTGSSIDNVNVIAMGDVLDVQRRRRDALVEALQVTPYP